MVLEIKPMAEGMETEVWRPAFTTMADRFSMTHPEFSALTPRGVHNGGAVHPPGEWQRSFLGSSPPAVQEHPSLNPSVSGNRDSTPDISSATCAGVAHSKPRHGPGTHGESSQSAARQKRSATDFEVR